MNQRYSRLWNDNWYFVKTAPTVTMEEFVRLSDAEIVWQQVDLPHDWLIYNTLDLYENSIGWYRKEFTIEDLRTELHLERRHLTDDDLEAVSAGTGNDLEADTIGADGTWEAGHIQLRFDGVYMDSTVYVNGQKVGDWKYGYSTFEWDIAPYLQPGKNEVLVKVVHLAPNSRWYSGAGIYRNVWLYYVPAVHIPGNGIYVTTVEREGGYELLVDTELTWGACAELGELQEERYQVIYTLWDGETQMFTEGKPLTCGQSRDESNFFVDNPKRWDIQEPNLYRLEVQLVQERIGADYLAGENASSAGIVQSYGDKDKRIWQEKRITVGFRTIGYTPEQGFSLNGRKVRLNGTCDHHDLGALGAAFSKAAMRRKLLIMRAMGVNAIRTAHNMPAPELMDMADEMGFLIVSEAFDMWEIAKNPYDYARFFKEWAEQDVRSWVRRDRNHPCLIMWSIGNEIPDTHVDEHGQEITRQLSAYVREWDYRGNAPVTIGSNYMPWENAQKCADIIKVAGYNYAEKYYGEHHNKYPDWIIYGSETSSVVQSRGIYHFPLERATLIEEDEQCSALGNSTTSWAAKSAEYCITMDRDAEYSCGQFIWTAFDYIGEPTPYQTKNCYFGQIDTAGFPKDSFYLYQAEWTDYRENPMIHIYPYWDFNPGQLVDIRVCSNAPVVELFVNGESQGKREIDHCRGTVLQPHWKVAYVPGNICAVAYDLEGKELARKERHSFGDTARLVLQADKSTLLADGEDMIFVEISAEDKDGYPVENAADYVRVTVSGAARLVGLDNGDSTDYDQYKGTVRKLFQGKLLAMLAAKTEPGEILLKVERVEAGIQGADKSGGADVAAELHLQAIAAPIREGISAKTENTPRPLAFVQEGFVPVRKVELVAEKLCLTAACPETVVAAKLYPYNATDTCVIWKVVDAAGMESRIAKIEPEACGVQARVTALGDGDFYVRCMSKNGTDKVKLISQLDMKIEGMGTAFVNPYEMVAGASYTTSSGDVSSGPSNSAGTDKEGATCLTYTNLDLGGFGSDEITLSIFANDNDAHNLQIWQGVPGTEGSELLGDVIYQKPGIWEVFQPETYRLQRRVAGVVTLTIVANDKLFLQGFAFTKQEKAFEKLSVAQTGTVYGDSYEVTAQGVEHIGNNVSVKYEEMNFGDEGAGSITICGRTPLAKNTIQIRFSGETESVQVLEFPHSEEYICQTFALEKICGQEEVTFVFLPGCNFDFAWFQFGE